MARGLGDNPFRRIEATDRVEWEHTAYDSVFYENRNDSLPEVTAPEAERPKAVSKAFWYRLKRLFVGG